MVQLMLRLETGSCSQFQGNQGCAPESFFLKCYLNTAQHDKEIFVARIGRPRRVIESLKAQVEHVANEAIEIHVRSKEYRLRMI